MSVIATQAVLAGEMAPPRRWRALHLLGEHGVARHTRAQLVAIEADRVRFTRRTGAARGRRRLRRALRRGGARRSLATALAGRRAEVHRIGDCVAPRTFEEAFYEATLARHAL